MIRLEINRRESAPQACTRQHLLSRVPLEVGFTHVSRFPGAQIHGNELLILLWLEHRLIEKIDVRKFPRKHSRVVARLEEIHKDRSFDDSFDVKNTKKDYKLPNL